MKIDIPSHLTDDDLIAQVKSLAWCEREATASLVAHLVELDARRLYLGAGFSSLFSGASRNPALSGCVQAGTAGPGATAGREAARRRPL